MDSRFILESGFELCIGNERSRQVLMQLSVSVIALLSKILLKANNDYHLYHNFHCLNRIFLDKAEGKL